MTAADTGILLIRIVIGITMFMHAYNHWFGGGKVAGTAGWFESLGLRPGIVQAWSSIVTEIAAGAGLILGFLTPLACAAAIGPMFVAGIVAHRKNGFFVFKDGYEYVLVIAVVAASIPLIGPGKLSLDRAIGLDHHPVANFLIAVIAGVGGSALLLAATWRPNQPAPTAAPEAD